MSEEEKIARLSDLICDLCPQDMELLDCAKLVVKAAVNAGITVIDLNKALLELYGK